MLSQRVLLLSKSQARRIAQHLTAAATGTRQRSVSSVLKIRQQDSFVELSNAFKRSETLRSISAVHPTVSWRRDDDDDQGATRPYTLPRIQVRRFSSAPAATHVANAKADKDGSSFRERARNRAAGMRESAAESYQKFRNDPGQSARSGAQSFAGMVKRYGPVFVGTYLGVYVATLGTLYLGVESGLADPATIFSMIGSGSEQESLSTAQLVADFLKKNSITEPFAGHVENNPSLANFGVAWVAVKFTEPIRLPLALSLTPRVAKYLGYTTKDDNDEEKGDGNAATKS